MNTIKKIFFNAVDEQGKVHTLSMEHMKYRKSFHDFIFRTPREFCEFAVEFLDSLKGAEYAKYWCDLKMSFFQQYQKNLNLLFSTRFGISFFSEVLNYLNNKEFLKPAPNEKLGIYDENFNKWLKVHRYNVDNKAE